MTKERFVEEVQKRVDVHYQSVRDNPRIDKRLF